jgi:hypothetical protein
MLTRLPFRPFFVRNTHARKRKRAGSPVSRLAEQTDQNAVSGPRVAQVTIATMRQLEVDLGEEDEDYLADFCAVSRRTLDEFELILPLPIHVNHHFVGAA